MLLNTNKKYLEYITNNKQPLNLSAIIARIKLLQNCKFGKLIYAIDAGTHNNLSCSLSTASLIWVHICLILTPGITAEIKQT